MRNKSSRILAGVGAAIAIVALAGCESTSSDKNEQRSEGRIIDDKNITADIKKGLESEPAYKFEGVDVRTYAGVVQLSGFVNTEGQKWRAQQIAEHADGVKQVMNGINLKPMMAPTSRANEMPKVYAEPQNPSVPQSSQPSQEPK